MGKKVAAYSDTANNEMEEKKKEKKKYQVSLTMIEPRDPSFKNMIKSYGRVRNKRSIL